MWLSTVCVDIQFFHGGRVAGHIIPEALVNHGTNRATQVSGGTIYQNKIKGHCITRVIGDVDNR